MTGAGHEPEVTGFALHGDHPAEPVVGRLVALGLHDELQGSAYVVVEGVDRPPYTPNLCPATRDELTQSLSFAHRINGRKRVHDADEAMARIIAERPVEHLERSGYVVTHKPPLGQHGAVRNPADLIEKATKTNRGE
jgi:hypothetical protein